jgi:hypothetical protein
MKGPGGTFASRFLGEGVHFVVSMKQPPGKTGTFVQSAVQLREYAFGQAGRFHFISWGFS